MPSETPTWVVQLDRLLYPVQETQHLLGISHATIYRLIAAKRLDAVKIGAKTLITAESISAFLAGLPKAGIDGD